MTKGTWTLLYLALFGAVLGTLLGAVLHFSDGWRTSLRTVRSEIDLGRLTKIHVALCVLLLLYVVWQMYLIPEQVGFSLNDLARIYFEGSDEGNLYRISGLDAQMVFDSSSLGVAGILQRLTSFVLFLGNASIFSGACLWVMGKAIPSDCPTAPICRLEHSICSALYVSHGADIFLICCCGFENGGVRSGENAIGLSWPSKK